MGQYANPWTIAGERARFAMGQSESYDLYNKQGTWIDKNNWDGWTLQSASLIRDPQGRFDRFECGPKFLATAWTEDDSKTVYVGLHHWGSLDPDGNKIPNGTHIKDLGYFEEKLTRITKTTKKKRQKRKKEKHKKQT